MCGGRISGVAFSLVTCSWQSKRKSPARTGGARKMTGMSAFRPETKNGSRLRRDDEQSHWVPGSTRGEAAGGPGMTAG